MKVGFIGLGNMGSGMAANLLKAGHEVTVYNRTPSKAQALVEHRSAESKSRQDARRAAPCTSPRRSRRLSRLPLLLRPRLLSAVRAGIRPDPDLSFRVSLCEDVSGLVHA